MEEINVFVYSHFRRRPVYETPLNFLLHSALRHSREGRTQTLQITIDFDDPICSECQNMKQLAGTLPFIPCFDNGSRHYGNAV